jgi:hypothetical protein
MEHLVKSRAKIISVLTVGGLLIVLISTPLLRRSKETTYENKSASQWFYGSGHDFYLRPKREAAQTAFNALGTNALPFLLSTLKQRGSTALYVKLYYALPSPLRAPLPYPVPADDVHMLALDNLTRMREMPPEWLAALAKQVPELKNPRIRYRGLMTVQRLAGKPPEVAFTTLCRQLLTDPHFGIRLEAAIMLATAEPAETNTFPILLGALESTEKLSSAQSLRNYSFHQPPGKSASTKSPAQRLGAPDPVAVDKQRVLRALKTLQPQLDAEQKRLLLLYTPVEQTH